MRGILKRHILEHWDRYGTDMARPRGLDSFIYHGSRVTTFLFFPDNLSYPVLVAKVARRRSAVPFLRQEYEHTTRVHALLSDAGYRAVPKPFFLGEVQGFDVLIQSMVRGHRLTTLSTAKFATFTAAREWLLTFHSRTKYTALLDEDLLIRYFLDPIQRFSCLCTLSEAGKKYLDALTAMTYTLRSKRFPFVFLHGDYSVSNILLDDGRISVIDWTNSDERGLPLVDLYQCALSYAKLITNLPLLERMKYTLLEENAFCRYVRRSFKIYCDTVGLDTAFVPFLVALRLIQQVNAGEDLVPTWKQKLVDCYNCFASHMLKTKGLPCG